METMVYDEYNVGVWTRFNLDIALGKLNAAGEQGMRDRLITAFFVRDPTGRG